MSESETGSMTGTSVEMATTTGDGTDIDVPVDVEGGADDSFDKYLDMSGTSSPEEATAGGAGEEDPAAFFRSMMGSPSTPMPTTAHKLGYAVTPAGASLANRFVSDEVPEEDMTLPAAVRAAVEALESAVETVEEKDTRDLLSEAIGTLTMAHTRRVGNLKSIVQSQDAHLQQIKTNELDLARAEAEEFERYLTEALETNDLLNAQIEEANAEIERLRNALSEAQAQASTLQTNLDAKTEESSGWQQGKEVADGVIQELQAQREEAHAQVDALEAERVQLSQALENLQTTLAEQERVLEETQSSAQTTGETLTVAEAEVERLTGELSEAEDARDEANAQRLALEDALAQAKLDVESAEKEAKQANALNETLTSQVESLSDLVSQSSSDASSHAQALEAERVKGEARIKALESEVDEVRSALRDATTEAAQAEKAAKVALDKAEARAKKQMAEAERKIGQAGEALAEAEDKIQKQEAQVASLVAQQEEADARLQAEVAKTAELTGAMSGLQAELEGLQANVKDLTVDLEGRDKSIAALQTETKMDKEILVAAQQELETVSGQRDAAEAEVMRLRGVVQEKDEALSGGNSQLKDVLSRKTELESEVARQGVEIKSLTADLDTLANSLGAETEAKSQAEDALKAALERAETVEAALAEREAADATPVECSECGEKDQALKIEAMYRAEVVSALLAVHPDPEGVVSVDDPKEVPSDEVLPLALSVAAALRSSRESVADLEEQVVRLEAELEDSNEELKSQVLSLESALGELTETYTSQQASSRERFAELEMRLVDTEGERDTAVARGNRVQAEADKAVGRAKNAEHRVETLEMDLAGIRLAKAELEEELGPLRQKVMTLVDTNAALEEETEMAGSPLVVASLQNELAETQKDLESARTQLGDMGVLIGVLKRAQVSLFSRISHMSDDLGHPLEIKIKYPRQTARLPALSDSEDEAAYQGLTPAPVSDLDALSAKTGINVRGAFDMDEEEMTLFQMPKSVEDLVAELSAARRTNRILKERLALYESPESEPVLEFGSMEANGMDDYALLMAFEDDPDVVELTHLPGLSQSTSSGGGGGGPTTTMTTWELLQWMKEALKSLGLGKNGKLTDESLAAHPRMWLDAMIRQIDRWGRTVEQLEEQYVQALSNAAQLAKNTDKMLRSQRKAYASDRKKIMAEADDALEALNAIARMEKTPEDVVSSVDGKIRERVGERMLRREIEDLQTELASVQASNEALIGQNAEQLRDLAGLRARLARQGLSAPAPVPAPAPAPEPKEKKGGEVGEVGEVDEVDGLLTEAREVAEGLELELDEVQLQLELETAELAQVRGRLEVAEAAVQSAEAEARSAEAEARSAEAEVRAAQAEVRAAQADVRVAEGRAEAAEGMAASLKAELESLEGVGVELRMANAKVAALEAERERRGLEERAGIGHGDVQRMPGTPKQYARVVSLAESEDLSGYLAPSGRSSSGGGMMGGSGMAWTPPRRTGATPGRGNTPPGTPGQILQAAMASSNPMGALKMHLVSLRGLWQHEVKANAALRELVETMRADRDRVTAQARMLEETHMQTVADKDRALDELRLTVAQQMASAQAHSSSLVETITANLAELQGSQSSLSARLSAAESEALSARAETKRARDEADAAVRKLDAARDASAAATAAAAAESAELQAMLADARYEREELVSANNSLRMQLERVQADSARAEESIGDLAGALERCRTEIHELTSAKNSAIHAGEVTQASLEGAQSQLGTQARMLEELREELRAERSRITDLTKENRELRQEKRGLEQSVEMVLREKAEMEGTQSEFYTERMELMERIAELEGVERELDTVGSALRHVEAVLEQERDISSRASSDLVEVQTKYAQSELERASLDSHLRSVRGELSAAVAERKRVVESLERTQEALEEARRGEASARAMGVAEKEAMQAQLEAAAVSSQQVQDSITRDFEAAALMADENGRALAATKAELENVRAELASAREDAMGAREQVRRAQAETAEAMRAAEVRGAEVASVSASADRARAEINEIVQMLTDKREECSSALDRVAELESKLEAAVTRGESAEAMLAPLQARVERAEAEVADLQGTRASEALSNAESRSALESAKERALAQVRDARVQLEDSRAEVSALREELAASRRRSMETSAIASQASQAAMERARTAGELTEARKEVARLQSVVRELQDRSITLQTDDSALREEVLALRLALDKERQVVTKTHLGFRMLQHELSRSQAFRASLIAQKQYLIVLLGGFEACENATMSYLSSLGALEYVQPGSLAEKRRTALRRFKAAAHVVRGTIRLRKLARRSKDLENYTRQEMAGLGEVLSSPPRRATTSVTRTPALRESSIMGSDWGATSSIRALNPSAEFHPEQYGGGGPPPPSAELSHEDLDVGLPPRRVERGGGAMMSMSSTSVLPPPSSSTSSSTRMAEIEFELERERYRVREQERARAREAASREQQRQSKEKEAAYARLAQLRSSTRAEIEQDRGAGRTPSPQLTAYLASIDDAMKRLL